MLPVLKQFKRAAKIFLIGFFVGTFDHPLQSLSLNEEKSITYTKPGDHRSWQALLQITLQTNNANIIKECKLLTSNSVLLDFDIVVQIRHRTTIPPPASRTREEKQAPREVVWNLRYGADRSLLSSGSGLPSPLELAKILEIAGFKPALPRLRAYVNNNDSNATARLRLIEILIHRSRKLLWDSDYLSESHDIINHGELAHQIRRFMSYPDWHLRAEPLGRALALLERKVRSPVLRASLESANQIVRAHCTSYPSDVGAWTLLINLAQALDKPLDFSGLQPGAFVLPPGLGGVKVPYTLPGLILKEAKVLGRWREALPVLQSFWEEGALKGMQGTLGPEGVPNRTIIASMARANWKNFALPYLEALLRIGEEGKVVSFLTELDEGWLDVSPFDSTASLADAVGRSNFAAKIRRMKQNPIRPIIPDSIRSDAALYFNKAEDKEQAQTLADYLAISGIFVDVKHPTQSMRKFLGWSSPEGPLWALVDPRGRVLGTAATWNDSPEEEAQSLSTKGLQPAWDRARRILSDRPSDVDALSLQAASEAKAAILLRYRSINIPRNRWESRFRSHMDTYFEVVERLFQGGRLPNEGSLTWVIAPILQEASDKEYSDRLSSLCAKATRVLEDKLIQFPDQVDYWRAWCILKATQGLSLKPKFLLTEDLRDMNIGPFPPQEIWGLLVDLSSKSKSILEISNFLLQTLEQDLLLHDQFPNMFNKNEKGWERLAIGLPLLVRTLLATGQHDALESFLSRCATQGVQGVSPSFIRTNLPESIQNRFSSLLKALE